MIARFKFNPAFSITSVSLMALMGFCFGSGAFGLGILFYTLSCLSVGANLSANRYPISTDWVKRLGDHR